MSTPREKINQALSDEVDKFAARVKQMIEHYEFQAKAHERLLDGLSAEIDRLNKEKTEADIWNSDRQASQQ